VAILLLKTVRTYYCITIGYTLNTNANPTNRPKSASQGMRRRPSTRLLSASHAAISRRRLARLLRRSVARCWMKSGHSLLQSSPCLTVAFAGRLPVHFVHR